jgi:hypothetical protein
MKNKI